MNRVKQLTKSNTNRTIVDVPQIFFVKSANKLTPPRPTFSVLWRATFSTFVPYNRHTKVSYVYLRKRKHGLSNVIESNHSMNAMHMWGKLLLIQTMTGGDQSISSTAARLGQDQRDIQILALAFQLARDGAGLLGLDEMERPTVKPNADNVFGIVVVLVLTLVEELALEGTAISVVGGYDGVEPHLHLALLLDAMIAVNAGGVGADELALEIVGVVGLGGGGGER